MRHAAAGLKVEGLYKKASRAEGGPSQHAKGTSALQAEGAERTRQDAFL